MVHDQDSTNQNVELSQKITAFNSIHVFKENNSLLSNQSKIEFRNAKMASPLKVV